MTNILSFAFGGILTILVGWYFYRKSIQRNAITPFLDYFSKVFDHLDPELKKDLLLQYKGQEIEFLYDIQFTIKNTGNKSIRDVIEPLTLKIPNELEVMDARLININPKGRQIELEQPLNSNLLKFKFSLLNREDSFTIKLLLKGDISKVLEEKRHKTIKSKIEKLLTVDDEEINDEVIIDDFSFSITVDDIPPALQIKKESSSQSVRNENTIFDGVFYLVVGLSIGFVAWTYTHAIDGMYLPDFSHFFHDFFIQGKDPNISQFNYLKLAIFFTWGTAFVLTFRGFFDFIVPIVRFIINFVEKKLLNF